MKSLLPLLPFKEELEIAGINDSSDEENSGEVHETSSANEQILDIIINNVVCSFAVRRQLDLKEIALRGSNVEYKKESGMVTMRLRPRASNEPYVTASIWKSGKVTCTGATSEHWALITAKRVARILANLYPCVALKSSRDYKQSRQHRPIKSISNYRVVNVLGTCRMPFAIKISQFTTRYGKYDEMEPNEPFATYEPELHPGVTVRYDCPKATLKVFSTGSVTITASCTDIVNWVVHDIYPRLENFQRERNEGDISAMRKQRVRKYEEISDFYLDEVDGINESFNTDIEMKNELDECYGCVHSCQIVCTKCSVWCIENYL